MESIQLTPQHLLIYTAILLYMLALVITLLGRHRAGNLFFLAGFIFMAVVFIYRWYYVGHIPLQNLYEVFLTMGLLIYPLSLFCRRLQKSPSQATDILLGIVLLIPVGFVFDAEPKQLLPALQCWLFAPHVGVYMLAYVIMTKAGFQAVFQLLRPPAAQPLIHEQAAYRLVCLGFPLLSLGLVLGSWWGKLAWGDFWGWDPKELWSLASWLIYLAYFHFRYMHGQKFPRLNSLWVLLGFAAIVITLLWVNLARIFSGLHSYA